MGTRRLGPGDVSIDTDPRPVERRFIMVRVEPDAMAGVAQPGGGLILNLADPIDQYKSEWKLASHTFTLTEQGVGLVSVIFERIQ